MGNISIYDEKELERDRKKKFKKYHKNNLKNLGLDLSIFSKECQNKVIDFFLENTESEDKIKQILNLIKKYDLETYEVLLNKFKVENKEEVENTLENDLRKNISPIFERFEHINMLDGYEDIFFDYIKQEKKFLFNVKEMLIKNSQNTLINLKIETLLIENLIFAWENIFFSRSKPEEIREGFYIYFKEFLNEQLQELEEKKSEETLDIELEVLMYSFLSLKKLIHEKFYTEIEVEFKKDIEGLKESFEPMFIKISTKNINFKDLKTKNIKKDNNFKSRIEDIKKLIEIFNKKDDGAILYEIPELLELLYIIFYKNDDNVKVHSENWKKKKFFTLIKYVLDGNDPDGKILNVLNKYVRIAMFVFLGKEKEIEYILELESLLKKLFLLINRVIDPSEISSQLYLLIISIFMLIEEIESYYKRSLFY